MPFQAEVPSPGYPKVAHLLPPTIRHALERRVEAGWDACELRLLQGSLEGATGAARPGSRKAGAAAGRPPAPPSDELAALEDAAAEMRQLKQALEPLLTLSSAAPPPAGAES